jgi:antitoxin component YwqK of YwqJK toxin-antitoxin module
MRVHRWVLLACILAGGSVWLGCSGTTDVAEKDGQDASGAAADSNAGSGNAAASAKRDEIVIPPPKAEIKTVESLLPGSKVLESRAQIKHYSDNSFALHGDYEEFWLEGGKFVEGEYRDDRRDGTRRYYHPSGQIAREVNYKDGVPHGRWTRYRADGSKAMDVEYKDGKRHGKWLVYARPDAPADEEGAAPADASTAPAAAATTTAAAAASATAATATAATEPRIVRQDEYQDGKRHGTFITWYPNGNKATEVEYRNDQRHGKELSWFPSSKPRTEATFVNGLAHGTVTMWSELGKVVSRQEFRQGKLVRSPIKTASR